MLAGAVIIVVAQEADLEGDAEEDEDEEQVLQELGEPESFRWGGGGEGCVLCPLLNGGESGVGQSLQWAAGYHC
jgi:hypothetical protein